MKYCINCGQVMLDSTQVCGRCGFHQSGNYGTPQAMQTHTDTTAQDQACLDRVRTGLRHERTAWKIYAVATTVITGVTLLCLLLMGGLISDFGGSYNYEELFILVFYIVFYSIYVVFGFIPLIIAGFIMSAKCKRYLNNFSVDPASAVAHSASVGTIVLAALFNNIALIFIIINFVYCKRHKASLERAIAQEQAAALPAYEGI